MKKQLLFLALAMIFSFGMNVQISPNTNNILYVNKSISNCNQSSDSWINVVQEFADALKYAKQTENIRTVASP